MATATISALAEEHYSARERLGILQNIADEVVAQAEIKYSDDTIFDGCDYIGQFAKQEAFIAGAKWADEHPNPNIIKKIFEFALGKTNFMIADGLQSIDFEVLVTQAMKE